MKQVTFENPIVTIPVDQANIMRLVLIPDGPDMNAGVIISRVDEGIRIFDVCFSSGHTTEYHFRSLLELSIKFDRFKIFEV